MTGPNNNVTRLMEVTTSLDGTDEALSSFRWTCPQVEPYSAIYFYRVCEYYDCPLVCSHCDATQFTNGDDLQGSKWTTRFTVSIKWSCIPFFDLKVSLDRFTNWRE